MEQHLHSQSAVSPHDPTSYTFPSYFIYLPIPSYFIYLPILPHPACRSSSKRIRFLRR
jgi:hypothetical protein